MASRPMRSRKSTPAAAGPVDLDGSVEWAARIVQPLRAVAHGSQQPLIIKVSSPEILDRQPVRVTIGGATAAAEWVGQPGRHRECVVTLGGRLPVPDGHATVQVRVDAASGRPVLAAGKITGI